MMEEITKIKDLQPGTQGACIQGTVTEVTPVVDRTAPPKEEPRKVASFVLQDDSGQVRVVVLGNYCRVKARERIVPGRPLKISWARVRRGQGGEAEILLHKGFTSVQGSPTPKEEA